MKKRILSAMAIVALMFGQMFTPTAQAQIFLDDADMTGCIRLSDDSPDLPIIPWLDITTDQYAPLGSGVLALGLLGGAYLVAKRRKED